MEIASPWRWGTSLATLSIRGYNSERAAGITVLAGGLPAPGWNGGYGMLVRALYFLLVGWWAALLWGLVGYLLCLSIVLLPLGVVMLNRIPQVLTLKPAATDDRTGLKVPELPFVVRAVWFVFVGSWLALKVFLVGYLLCLTIVGLPLGVWVIHQVPLALTLKQAS